MEQYQKMLKHVLENGRYKEDRTGVGCYSVFGYQNRYDLSQGFPIVTTKKILFDKVVDELLWFLSGSTNVNDLPERSQGLWKPWANKDGELGLIYGEQWRNSGSIGYERSGEDQIANVIKSLKQDPFSRRHMVSSWIPFEIEFMNLPPCHCLFQFFVEEMSCGERILHLDYIEGTKDTWNRHVVDILKDEYGNVIESECEKVLDELNVPKLKLSCQLYQRSADLFLGVGFNISSYALLTHMIAQVCGYGVGEFIHSFGDLHLYANHVEQAKLQLSREPKSLPRLWLNPEIKNIDDFKFEDIRLEGYEHHAFIKAPVAV